MAKRKTPIRHDPIVAQLAGRLRELRRARGLTQPQLARAAHITETYVSKLENGQIAPGVDLVARLSRALTCSVSDLLPAEPPDLDAIQDEARRLFDEVIRSGSRESIQLVLSVLARIAQTLEHR